MFLLPRLKILNGKDISATANHIRYVNSEILRKRVSFDLGFYLYVIRKLTFSTLLMMGSFVFIFTTGDWGVGEELQSP